MKIEVDWLKKNLSSSARLERQALIDFTHSSISIRRQCELLGVARASVYYESTASVESDVNDKTLMDMIDLQYSQTPFYGSRKIALALSLQLGSKINRKRIQRHGAPVEKSQI